MESNPGNRIFGELCPDIGRGEAGGCQPHPNPDAIFVAAAAAAEDGAYFVRVGGLDYSADAGFLQSPADLGIIEAGQACGNFGWKIFNTG